MQKLTIGKKYQIQCYKHNDKIHRAWDEAVLLDIKQDYLVFANNKTTVIEAEGNVWKTKEPAIMYFFNNRWFNIITQLKKDGTYFYCNIATPYIIEEDTIKYIDYDLDLRIFPSGQYKILDRWEYKYHSKKMGYPEDLKKVIKKSLDELISCYELKNIYFDQEKNQQYYNKYIKMKKNTKIGNF